MEFASTKTLTCLRRLKNKNQTGRMELSYFFQKTRRMEFASTQTLTCLRRLKKKTGRMELSYFFQSAEADIVCIDANSIRRLIYYFFSSS